MADEKFVVHPEKISVMRKGSRQEVTGIVVNSKPGINRKMLHRFRALIQQVSKNGLANKKWKGGNIAAEMLGYANFVAQVKPDQGNKMKKRLQEIFLRPDIQKQIQELGLLQIAKPLPKKPTSAPVIEKKDDSKNWWDVV